jgi:GTP-binding protein YchF
MMKIGLVGLPNSGKTTIFNALTKSEAEVTSYASQKAEPHIAIIEVADQRVDKLTEMYQPKKTTFATIELVDFVGFSEGTSRNGGLPASFVTHIKTMDAIALVVRNFGDDFDEAPDPLGDIDTILTEFILSDLIITENRIEKIEESFRRGKKTVELEREEKLLRRIEDTLNENCPVRAIELTREEKRMLSGFQYLTQKQLLVIVNSAETNFGKNSGLISAIDARFSAIEFAGNFEMELSRLDDEEGALFMEDMGIEESARDRLTRSAYELLGLISFLTVGTDEVRAWTIHSGDTALDAAGTIHSDLARGFIRAECFSYENLVECGSEKGVRDKGHFRLEGKEYVISDGDILGIRFSV